MSPFEALKHYFNFDEFRPGQKEIIDAIMTGKNVLAVLPTGAGKSLCYQIPALISESFSIVISPLIALMKDQVDSLNKKYNLAAFINSSMSYGDAEEVLRNIAYGRIKMLYVAPERLENISFAERIKSLQPSFVFVDEAHCISEWGHNFRPSYTRISNFIDFISIKHISAFTATATPEVVKDIVGQLNLKDPQLFVKGFERENLHLNVISTKKKNEKCIELIKTYKTPAIIYSASRKKAEEAAQYLNMHRINCGFYHAGLQPEVRRKIQEDFLNDKLQVIAATNAFGMGIDKKDIRLIIHYNIPGSIENYYQEIGRAGRDGKPSHAFLLFDESDINIQNYFIASSNPDQETICGIYDAICDYGKVAEGSESKKEIPVNIEFISACLKKEINKGMLYTACRILADAGYIKLLSEYEKRAGILFLTDKENLKQFVKSSNNSLLKEAVLLLLRVYGSSLFIKKTNISVSHLATQHEFTEGELHEAFVILGNLGILDYSSGSVGDSVLLTAPRTNSRRLNLDYKKINENFIRLNSKLDKMVQLVYLNDCRFKFILDYFGALPGDYKCGRCDKCLSYSASDSSAVEYISEIILRTVYLDNNYINETTLIKIIRGTAKRETGSDFETFGSLSSYSINELKPVISNMVSMGLLSRIKNGKELALTKKGLARLNEQELTDESQYSPLNYDEHLELYNSLKTIRKKASVRFMQAAYLICPDETLREITLSKPADQKEFLKVKGTNERMYYKVGEEMIKVIKELADKVNDMPEFEGKAPVKKDIPDEIKETYKLLLKEYSLKDIASLRNLNEAVISMQIETLVEFIPGLKVSFLFPGNLLKEINEQLSRGYKDLRDLKSRLPSEATYPLIRIAAAVFKAGDLQPS